MERKYQVVYADPPWRYDFSKSDSRKIENQYPTMSTLEICAMRVPTAPDAVLFLWGTAPKLKDALAVMEAWGSEYKSHLIWDKVKIGMGYWARGQHELLLVGTKGKFPPPPAGMRIGSVIRIPRTIHSRKPAAIRDWITKWYPEMRRLELFARQRIRGWDVFGNEVSSDVDVGNGNGADNAVTEPVSERPVAAIGNGLFDD